MLIKRSLAILALSLVSHAGFAATLVDVSEQGLPRLKSSDYQLEEIKRVTDSAGNIHIRYEQQYQGLPVYGHQVIEHQYQPSLAATGVKLSPYTGQMVQGIENDISQQGRAITSDAQASLNKLKSAYAQANHFSVEQLDFINVIAREVIYLDEQQVAHLAHEVSFFVELAEGGSPARPYYIVEASSGKILKTWDGLTSEKVATGPGGNDRIGVYHYGKDLPKLDVSKSRGRCTFTSPAGKTVDMGNGYGKSTTAYSYGCRRSLEQSADANNGAASPLNDAHYFIDILTQFYAERYKSSPVPFPLVMRTHYGKEYANAFWNGSSMTYGDGNKDLYPFVVLDISAHEIAHGFTEVNSGLVYEGQSGGLNESFSDMASRAVEYFVYGEHDWFLGGDIFKDTNKLALRFMDTPSRDGNSIEHVSQYTNSLDVHYTSGIFNKAFYLLSVSPGWNTAEAFDVMLYANAGYWQPNSTFATAAWGVVQAAAANGRQVDDVIKAFNHVGIRCDKVAGKCV
jgi:vibriolysin